MSDLIDFMRPVASSLVFNAPDLISAVGADVIKRGVEIARRGGVRRSTVSADGARISSSVLGDQGRSYQQNIVLSRTGTKLHVRGYCTCPMSSNCKHVAAALVVRIIELEQTAPSAAPEEDAPGDPAVSARPQIGLQPGTRLWLERIAKVSVDRKVSVPSSTGRALRFVLSVDPSPGLARITVVTVQPTKSDVRDPRPVDPAHWDRLKKQNAKYATEGDIALLRGLDHLARSNGYPSISVPLLPDLGTTRLLEKLLESGRLHYGTFDGPILRSGKVVAAELFWTQDATAMQRLQFVSREGVEFDGVIAIDPPHYIVRATSEIGPISTGLPRDLAVEIARAPAIGPSEAALVKNKIE